MDTALLTCANTDSLTVLNVANRVGLSILKSDKCNNKVDLCLFGDNLIIGNNVL